MQHIDKWDLQPNGFVKLGLKLIALGFENTFAEDNWDEHVKSGTAKKKVFRSITHSHLTRL